MRPEAGEWHRDKEKGTVKNLEDLVTRSHPSWFLCDFELSIWIINISTVDLESILKSRNITLPTKVYLVKAMLFPVVMYGYESWTIKKAQRGRIDAFELLYWEKILLRVLWTTRRSNQSILKEISLEYSLKDWCWSWNSNTWATSCEELTHLKRLWCWERLKAGGEEDDRGWDVWMASPTQWTWVWVNSWSWWWTGRPGVLQSMGSQRVRHDWETKLNSLELGPALSSAGWDVLGPEIPFPKCLPLTCPPLILNPSPHVSLSPRAF